ncbi:hypothetical protein [Calothrix sp. NIES-2100]|uniref:hypothetical protein n=1 Tax=Calothrix sp. NIES-2100 TaxID=1954172 RepID=UPI000BBC78F9
MSKPEQPPEEDKPSTKQTIVQDILLALLLIPSLLFVFSMIITDYLAEKPPDRWFDDAAKNSKGLACETRKQNKDSDPVADCEK